MVHVHVRATVITVFTPRNVLILPRLSASLSYGPQTAPNVRALLASSLACYSTTGYSLDDIKAPMWADFRSPVGIDNELPGHLFGDGFNGFAFPLDMR
jgi:hypothetical protein